VVGVNLAGIVTTSAVITGAIAFSAQEVLAALWAGMALQAERTIRLGDWIRVGQSTGQVVGIRWRATSILTRANEVIIVPNVQLIRNPVHVLGRGTTADLPLRILSFPVDYAHPPSLVVRMINDALRRAELANVASDPAPGCVCVGFGERGADYEVLYHILDLRRFKETDSEVYSHVFVALKRCGMRIPPPRLDMTMQRGTPEAALERTARMAAVAEFDLAASLTEDERRALADELVTCPFADGDILFRQNEPADSLYILAHGRLDVVDDSHGSRQKLATIEAPSYVGEMGLLTGQARLATVIADGDVVCYRLHKTGFDAILRNRPQIVEELSAVLARRQAENEAMMAALDASEAARRAPNRTADLVRRIRQFFVLG
jgi:CRP-like cAMP-binding protein